MVVKVWPLCRLLHVMEPSDFSDESLIFRLKTKLDQLIASRKYHVFDEDELTNILDELIIYLKGRNNSTSDLLIENQNLIDASVKLIDMVGLENSFKVAKVCQIWEHVVQLPDATFSSNTANQFLQLILQAIQLHNDEIIFPDILNCFSAAVCLKEIKQAKTMDKILDSSGILLRKMEKAEFTDLIMQQLSILKIMRNFTYCPGEKDWTVVSRTLISNIINTVICFIEKHATDQNDSIQLCKGFILCFHSLENVFVRFHTSTIPYLNQLVGICKSFMLFGVPGYTVNIQSISPSSVPFMEPAMKNELNITPKLRKKKPPKNNSKNRKINLKKIEPQPEHGECASYYDSNIKTWKTTAMNSSDSELSDSEGENLIRQREYQAKVRAAALKALTAAFKFCDQRTVTSYWSAFLPDSSQGHVFRYSLMTPILKDSSPKVRCRALNALSTLIQAIQPTLAMANYQENRSGSFIPFSQTLAEMAITVQRSLLLVLSAEQSNAAFIQLFKCLTVVASVFPYAKLPSDLVPKTIKQCIPFLEFKDPDVKVACLSMFRVIICNHSTNKEVASVFWNSSTKKCWLLEHCLNLVQAQSGFPLTLESLLVLGEVSRSNIQLAQYHVEAIVHVICHKMQNDSDTGIQIRCAKVLALVCSSILQEMDKDETEQRVTRDEAVQLWIYILRHGLPEALQNEASPPLRAEACATLATVGSHIFECLPRDLRIMLAAMVLGCASDSDPSVRAAAVRTLGFAVTFSTLMDDASFLLDSSEAILGLLEDKNALVNLNSSWALGNIAETLEKNKNLLEEELPSHFLTDLIRASCHASQGPIKVRGNVVRALGIFLKLVTVIPAEGCETSLLLDQAISIVIKQVTTGNFMKNRWNACYAIGNIFHNAHLLKNFSHWMEKLLESLLSVLRSCLNFKVRIAAASAMLHLSSRTLLSKNYFPIWTALLESLASSEQINDFAEYQHHERFEMQICTTICKLITLMTSDDLSTLHEILIKYYDTCGLCFEKFLKSVLPDQLELLLEASTHIQHMNMTTAYYLTPDKKSALNLFNDLLQLTH